LVKPGLTPCTRCLELTINERQQTFQGKIDELGALGERLRFQGEQIIAEGEELKNKGKDFKTQGEALIERGETGVGTANISKGTALIAKGTAFEIKGIQILDEGNAFIKSSSDLNKTLHNSQDRLRLFNDYELYKNKVRYRWVKGMF
jgi:hypothetical protein